MKASLNIATEFPYVHIETLTLSGEIPCLRGNNTSKAVTVDHAGHFYIRTPAMMSV